MTSRNGLLLAIDDYKRLAALIYISQSDLLEPLMMELDRATILPQEQLPIDVVRMNSTFIYKDLDSGEESQVTLVYPEDSDISLKKISVLAPIGSALIGLREGQKIEWELPNGKTRRIEVLRILYHPASADRLEFEKGS